jgi:hypothetical protein
MRNWFEGILLSLKLLVLLLECSISQKQILQLRNTVLMPASPI